MLHRSLHDKYESRIRPGSKCSGAGSQRLGAKSHWRPSGAMKCSVSVAVEAVVDARAAAEVEKLGAAAHRNVLAVVDPSPVSDRRTSRPGRRGFACSNSSTRKPRSTAATAAASPASPPPTIATSRTIWRRIRPAAHVDSDSRSEQAATSGRTSCSFVKRAEPDAPPKHVGRAASICSQQSPIRGRHQAEDAPARPAPANPEARRRRDRTARPGRSRQRISRRKALVGHAGPQSSTE